MSESIEKIAEKDDPKHMQKIFMILPYITGSKPTSTNLLKVNRRA